MREERGSTLVELAVVVALIGIGVGVAASLDGAGLPALERETERVRSHVAGARARALLSDAAVRVVATNSSTLDLQTAPSCASGTWATQADQRLTLQDVTASATGNLCWGASGLPATGWQATVTDGTDVRQVDVLLGGAVEVSE